MDSFEFCSIYFFKELIGRSENKYMKQFSLFENEVRPGVLMILISFSYLEQVLPSSVNMVAKCGHPV